METDFQSQKNKYKNKYSAPNFCLFQLRHTCLVHRRIEDTPQNLRHSHPSPINNEILFSDYHLPTEISPPAFGQQWGLIWISQRTLRLIYIYQNSLQWHSFQVPPIIPHSPAKLSCLKTVTSIKDGKSKTVIRMTSIFSYKRASKFVPLLKFRKKAIK